MQKFLFSILIFSISGFQLGAQQPSDTLDYVASADFLDQEITINSERIAGSSNDKNSPNSAEERAAVQTQEVLNQIRIHIENSLEYTEALHAQRIQGRVVLSIELSEQGQLIESSIHTPLADDVDRLALGVIRGLELVPQQYVGARKILVPLDFKLY